MKGGAVLFLGVEGKALTKVEERILRRVKPAGIVLVTRNIGGERELKELLATLRRALPEALFCLDAEGGRVDRLKGIVGSSPSAAELAESPPAAARRAGRRIGASLRTFGFDLDFAPVVDLDHGHRGNALDQRTFGANPRAVVARAGAFAQALRAERILACLKHFPGLGDAPADTHLIGTRIELTAQALQRELAPFVALLPEVQSVMVSHATYPGWGEPGLPASLSRKICDRLLRRTLGYRGVLFSDDLEMGALGAYGSLPALAAQALAAGCDGLLFCRQIDEAPEIARRLGASALARRLHQATRRITSLRHEALRLSRGARA